MADILVADDDPLARRFVAFTIASIGHRAILAEDGNEALAVIASREVDLALVDLLMPDKDGIETIISAKKIKPGLKIIAMSAGAKHLHADQLVMFARELGADDGLLKPFSAEVLRMTIQGHLAPPPRAQLK